MKSWLSRFKISAALDAEPSPTSCSPKQSVKSADAERFTESVQSVHRALRNQAPAVETPTYLHFAIMNEVRQAVRTSSTSQPKRSSKSSLRWLPAPAVLALGLIAAWWLLIHRVTPSIPKPEKNQIALAEVGPALELGASAPRNIPPVVVGPLSDELDRMNADLKSAAGFLLSSLP